MINVLNIRVLNSYHLKIIALITMIIDHFATIFIPEALGFRIIGRISFVLYAFMLVEGYYNTRNFKKYISKVFIWALISELPFDLAISGKIINWQEQNIFFSLLFGLGAIYMIENSKIIIFKIIIAAIFLSAATICNIDYSWYGIALILSFYFLRNNWAVKFFTIEVLSILASFKIIIVQVFAFIGFIPILLYNGARGRKIGDIYYSFYALHLFIFAIIKIYLC